jgi:hypothetical protein
LLAAFTMASTLIWVMSDFITSSCTSMKLRK